MVRTIAGEHSLVPAVAEALAGVVLPHVDQVAESDINMLTRLVRDHGGIVKPAGGSLLVTKKQSGTTASGTSLPGRQITRKMVSRHRVVISKRDPAGSVTAAWHDYESGEDVQETVGEGDPVKELRHLFPDAESAQAAAEAVREWGRSERAKLGL